MGRYDGLITGKTAKIPSLYEVRKMQEAGRREVLQGPAIPPPSTAPKPDRKTPNKTESRYATEVLEILKRTGELLAWQFQPITLRLAKNTTYTPDFLLIYPSGWLWFDEIKGFERDDAVVKFKVAAELYPGFRFRMVKLIKREWVITRDLNSDPKVCSKP